MVLVPGRLSPSRSTRHVVSGVLPMKKLAFLAIVFAASACAHAPPDRPRHTTPRPQPHAGIAWSDSIQNACEEAPWGFSQIQLERPIGQSVNGSDEVDLYRVPDPLGGPGYALKHVATFDNNGGSRSQAGIYSFANQSFDSLVKSTGGVYIAVEWLFPEPITAHSGRDSNPWINLWDFHSVSNSERWHTQPGLMLAEDGSMRVKWSWTAENPETDWSTIALPVGEWFDIEMHYVWSSGGGECGGGATVSLWINGELALEQRNVVTKGQGHDSVETYQKFYGSANNGTDWTPTPSVKYMRNVRMSASRIWR
jgi:Polysaccharide lyase